MYINSRNTMNQTQMHSKPCEAFETLKVFSSLHFSTVNRNQSERLIKLFPMKSGLYPQQSSLVFSDIHTEELVCRDSQSSHRERKSERGGKKKREKE